jgi:molecular chaperone HtpG
MIHAPTTKGVAQASNMNNAEKHYFQVEIKRLLEIFVHSLYSDEEIFVREVISNCADACERFRVLVSAGNPVYQAHVPPAISITTNEEQNTIAFTDSGIGMTREELVNNLSKIAQSGTQAAREALSSNGTKHDIGLIGKFGVGFYASFMVADEINVSTRSYGQEAEGWHWSSRGVEEYEIEPRADLPRGTTVSLRLKEKFRKYSQHDEILGVVERYARFIQFPIELNGTSVPTLRPLWLLDQKEVAEGEYGSLCKHVQLGNDGQLFHFHVATEDPPAFRALLFIPSRNAESGRTSRAEPGVSLYCRNMLMHQAAKGLVPEWLRFLKGMIDARDLPLNISREMIQDHTITHHLHRIIAAHFIKASQQFAQQNSEEYEAFYAAFGQYLKEGIASDPDHMAALGTLLRFASSALTPGKRTSFADYVKRMQPNQKDIYYILAANRKAAESSSYCELLRQHSLEVLFMHDPVDEFIIEQLQSFDGHKLVPVEKAADALVLIQDGEGLSPTQAEALVEWLQKSLGDQIQRVRVSKCLRESPAALCETNNLKNSNSNGQSKLNKSNYDLEINRCHKMINSLELARHRDPVLARKMAEQILDNARLAAGELTDHRPMLKRLTELFEHAIHLGI